MGEINISRDEQAALERVDPDEIAKQIERAIDNRRSENFYDLSRCGAYVSNKLHAFERELRDYAVAKSAMKQQQTRERALRAGYRLSSAIMDMKQRLETELKQRELFYVDDLVIPPGTFSRKLIVTVNYRWRKTVDDAWNDGRITFYHEPSLRPRYGEVVPKRKPSAAQQERKRQEELYITWEHLMRGSLYSVRDFFSNGGNGAEIPREYTATSSTEGNLNNYSTDFWRKPA